MNPWCGREWKHKYLQVRLRVLPLVHVPLVQQHTAADAGLHDPVRDVLVLPRHEPRRGGVQQRPQGTAGPELGIAGPELGIARPELGIVGPELGIAGPELGIAGPYPHPRRLTKPSF